MYKKAPDGILIGAYHNNKLIGFCAACTNVQVSTLRLIKSNIINYGIIGLKLLFTRPKSVDKTVKESDKKGSVADDGALC